MNPPLTHPCSATRNNETQAVEMLLSGCVPPEGFVARPSPGQPSPRAAAAPPMAAPRAFSPPQSQQDAVLEALHSRVLRLISLSFSSDFCDDPYRVPYCRFSVMQCVEEAVMASF
jgi:hypothetical protein